MASCDVARNIWQALRVGNTPKTSLKRRTFKIAVVTEIFIPEDSTSNSFDSYKGVSANGGRVRLAKGEGIQ